MPFHFAASLLIIWIRSLLAMVWYTSSVNVVSMPSYSGFCWLLASILWRMMFSGNVGNLSQMTGSQTGMSLFEYRLLLVSMERNTSGYCRIADSIFSPLSQAAAAPQNSDGKEQYVFRLGVLQRLQAKALLLHHQLF